MAQLPTQLTFAAAQASAACLQALVQAARPQQTVRLDLSGVERIDSVGAALLADCARQIAARKARLQVVGVQPHVQRSLRLFAFPEPAALPPPAARSWRQAGGSWAGAALAVGRDYMLLCADVLWFSLAGMGQRRSLRGATIARNMDEMGAQALLVVGLIAFLVGGTIALQSAAQLRQFGASLFVADLLGVSITRELGPLITAIVVAGRTGSSVAAEIGTMVITEEVDALRTMGLHPTRYLIVPKVLAIGLTQPILTVLANCLAIAGGLVVAVLYLDVSASAFIGRLQAALYAKDVLTGLFKSILFAYLTVTIGALCGLRTHGGADAVGRSTTVSVVAAIFAIIVADAVCSLVFYF